MVPEKAHTTTPLGLLLPYCVGARFGYPCPTWWGPAYIPALASDKSEVCGPATEPSSGLERTDR